MPLIRLTRDDGRTHNSPSLKPPRYDLRKVRKLEDNDLTTEDKDVSDYDQDLDSFDLDMMDKFIS